MTKNLPNSITQGNRHTCVCLLWERLQSFYNPFPCMQDFGIQSVIINYCPIRILYDFSILPGVVSVTCLTMTSWLLLFVYDALISIVTIWCQELAYSDLPCASVSERVLVQSVRVLITHVDGTHLRMDSSEEETRFGTEAQRNSNMACTDGSWHWTLRTSVQRIQAV